MTDQLPRTLVITIETDAPTDVLNALTDPLSDVIAHELGEYDYRFSMH